MIIPDDATRILKLKAGELDIAAFVPYPRVAELKAHSTTVEPELLIADEIVSAFDVSVQGQILNLLLDMQERLGLAMLFVSHDLRVVRHLAHHVAVMYLGKIVEFGAAEGVFASPQHPYTRALLSSAPSLDPSQRTTLASVAGELPSPLRRIAGCPFHPRRREAIDRCRNEVPLARVRNGHLAVCHLVG